MRQLSSVESRASTTAEGFDAWTGRPPPGIYATGWQAAFEQAMALAAREGALQTMQDELVAWRRRMLHCLRTDAALLLDGRPA